MKAGEGCSETNEPLNCFVRWQGEQGGRVDVPDLRGRSCCAKPVQGDREAGEILTEDRCELRPQAQLGHSS